MSNETDKSGFFMLARYLQLYISEIIKRMYI